MNTPLLPLFALLGASVLCACYSTSGSVSQDAIREALASPRMALTPSQPGWLLANKDIHALHDAQLAQVRALLQSAPVRQVPEYYYRSQEQGNRGDDTGKTFYLYASNAQCLGGRVIGNRVLMDDWALGEQQEQELYQILLPQLDLLGLTRN